MKNEIRKFIAATTFIDPEKIKDETMIFEEGIFDSMGLLGLINYFESEFGISVEDSDLKEENFGCINNMALFIARKKTVAA
ncbi:MAG: acyl carrier protein [Marinilabiliaceae bacterium]|nr:acyl carrier protein [Marinilabiliaceae bacterium]